MYGFVKYGDKKEQIINLNCRIFHLLRFLRKICELREEIEIDVSDLNGEVKRLNENLDSYACNLLRDKEEFILIRLERKPNDVKPVYIPLLTDNSLVNEDFLARLNLLKKTKASVSGSLNAKNKMKITAAKKKVGSPDSARLTSASPTSSHRTRSPLKSTDTSHKH